MKLKREKRAVILAHNYQRPEIQDLADHVGDSIELSRKAMEEHDAKIILFSAVDFMAESAALLNPDKKILLPSPALCPMAYMLPAEVIKLWKKKHSRVPVVLYVNTLAAAKAECDVCCTSANATKVVDSIDSDTVLFGPDKHLAWHVKRETGKEVIPIPSNGFCPTHVLFQEEDLRHLKRKHPRAAVMVHPECTSDVQLAADFIGSTSQMLRHARSSPRKSFIVGTEEGIIHRLQKENPDKKFRLIYEEAICPSMKLNTLERIYLSLKEERYPIKVPSPVAVKAREALERMFEIS